MWKIRSILNVFVTLIVTRLIEAGENYLIFIFILILIHLSCYHKLKLLKKRFTISICNYKEINRCVF